MWINGHAWIVTQTAQVAKAQRDSKKPAAKGNRTVFQREAFRTGGLATKACAGR
jgi:hypothetical protein